MKHKLNLVLFLFILAGCSQKQPTADTSNAISLDSISKDSSTTELTDEDILKTIPKNIKPILGYRFVIKGDFDGDGKKENLVEHFYSSIDNKETNKFYDGLDNYEQLVALTIKKMPYSFVLSDNAKIDTLSISISAQLLGLSYLKNEGDLNGDGTDEVSYVVNWADWSNMNTWHIMTYKSNRWEELYSFPIWDWQLPDLPETVNNYGLFGLQDKVMVPEDDSVNLLIEQNMQQFKGLVKKIKNNQIQVIFKNEEASEDTMLVDLTKKTN